MDAFRDSSSSSYRCSYHAFLSFRGPDTRKGFTDHLYIALEQAGIHTFRDDDEIERGENIELELDKAIQESQVSIIVFSKGYASSRWCLNELVKIVERRNTDRRHVVLPVFYDVDPSDVRKQSGSFAEAFARHEERFSTEEMDKVEQWRRALRDVASLGGMVLGDRARKILRASCSTLLAKERLLEVIKNNAMLKIMIEIVQDNVGLVSPRKNIEPSSFSLASLPHSLTSLRLDSCNLSEIPSALTMLSSLEYLDLYNNPITSLPESMNNLVRLHTLAVEGCRNLTMLPELPHSLKQLNGRGCTSLKRITNLPNLHISPTVYPFGMQKDLDLMHYNIVLDSNLWYCGKLVDVASLFNTLPLSSFDIKLLKDMDLFDLKPNGGVEVQRNNDCASFSKPRRSKGTFECGIISIFVHESKIPDRFNYRWMPPDRFDYRSMGNTVFSIIVPSQPNIKIVGLNACILYARQSDRSPVIPFGIPFGNSHAHSLELRNETKGLKWNLRMSTGVEWKVMNEDMLWLSHWIMGNNELECGEKVYFRLTEDHDDLFTKGIGVQFGYEQQNKDKEDVPSSSEDPMILPDRSPWDGGHASSWVTDSCQRFIGPKWIENLKKESISTVVCAANYSLCNHEVIDLENESRMTPW
ncbi:hypothetical protein DVH24_030767 [Malus domestica]|uniref:ADP-ribosyl cyclase/cyclic ADP-ribose hydrolase n=1 Tax=Malus domestica TaxID=3750 RepID=A0A498HDT4_MALDO|nr:hypothetical protein DVH24_030767 [Malus domestica]